MDLSRENVFDPLATQLHDLFESCKKAGFTDEQAFELIKTIVLWQQLIGH